MKFTTISRRIATTGAVAALGATALVGATSTVASAAPEASNKYNCAAGALQFPVTMKTNALGIEGFPSIGAGASLPAGLLTVTNHATMPAAAAQALGGNGVDHVEIPDFAANFGGNLVGVTGVVGLVSNIVNNGDGTVGLDLPKDDPATVGIEGGLNSAFETPVAGEYDIVMPSGFTINAYNSAGTLVAPITCALADGEVAQPLHHITVTKNASSTTAKAAKAKIAKGKAAKVLATVTGAKLTGNKVLLKKGAKTLATAVLSSTGKATLTTKKLPVGKNVLTVVYKGSGYNSASKSAPVTIKVVK